MGGNCVVLPEIFRKVRWRDTPWQRGDKTEDYYYTVAVKEAGWAWERVSEPCIIHLGTGTPKTDDYYKETWHAKGHRC